MWMLYEVGVVFSRLLPMHTNEPVAPVSENKEVGL
jgi:hypothetical protein